MADYPDRGLHGRLVQTVALDIVSGRLAPDTTVDLDQLGAQFDVSRTVVREAVKVLAAKGLLDARPKRGTFVRPRRDWNLLDPDVLRWQFEGPGGPSREMLDKLAEVRLIIEPPAAGLAARNRTQNDLEVIGAALTSMKRATADVEVITSADSAFHRAVLQASGNELLGEMAAIIEIGLRARAHFVHQHSVSMGPSLHSHEAVLIAIRREDPTRAEFEMRQLIQEAGRDAQALRDRMDAHRDPPVTAATPATAPTPVTGHTPVTDHTPVAADPGRR